MDRVNESNNSLPSNNVSISCGILNLIKIKILNIKSISKKLNF